MALAPGLPRFRCKRTFFNINRVLEGKTQVTFLIRKKITRRGRRCEQGGGGRSIDLSLGARLEQGRYMDFSSPKIKSVGPKAQFGPEAALLH